MKIREVILENFRAYRSPTHIPITDLTAFIGKNDAGKSTILEALDIFFEGGTVKLESSDANKDGNPKEVRIAVVFSDLPDEVILDSNAGSTLRGEFLLNGDGHLEIHKIYNCALATPKGNVFAWAVHPTKKEAADLLQQPNKVLKEQIKALGLEKLCNLTENPSMRHALYQAHGDLQLQPRFVPLNDENGKAVWTALQSHLPLFALFQSDRPSTDQDPEVQNPMKLAIEQALSELERELDRVTEEVRAKAQQTAERTLAHLQLSYPDLASTLQAKFKKPSWKSVFKLDLEADDGIPLNKRGSGVRRLVLLSFFQAEAERKRVEAEAKGQRRRSVVYAIEEPETSQHPDNQDRIVKTLIELASHGDQVLFTTHVPGLAGLIPLESLRYVDRDEARQCRVRSGDADVYEEIAGALGVLPDPVPRDEVSVAVLLEGKNDIDAVRAMASVLSASGVIAPLQDARIFWAIGGGESLRDWVERRYLLKLGLPVVAIVDSDRSTANLPIAEDKRRTQAAINAHPESIGFITRKRSMDNYVHPSTIHRLTGGQVDCMAGGIDLDFVRMDVHFKELLSEALKTGRLSFHATDLDGQPIAARKENAKRILNTYIMAAMTADEIRERSRYVTDDGKECFEVLEWLGAIAARC